MLTFRQLFLLVFVVPFVVPVVQASAGKAEALSFSEAWGIAVAAIALLLVGAALLGWARGRRAAPGWSDLRPVLLGAIVVGVPVAWIHAGAPRITAAGVLLTLAGLVLAAIVAFHVVAYRAVLGTPPRPVVVPLRALSPSDEAELPDEARAALREWHDAFHALGFAPLVRFVSERPAQGEASYGLLLERSADGTIVMPVLGRQQRPDGTAASIRQVVVTSWFADDRRVVTGAQDVPMPSTAPWQPDMIGLMLPFLPAAAWLVELHDRRARERERRVARRRADTRDPLAYLAGDERAVVAHWVRSGWWRYTPDGTGVRVSPLGAFFILLRFVNPGRAIGRAWRAFRARRTARRLDLALS